MALMALHEDSPLSDYVYFPIVKLDFDYFTDTLGVTPSWGNYTEGTSFGKRFNFSVTNDFIFRGLSANCPRTVFDDASIIKNNNTWEIVEGVYSRPDTVMTRIDNEQPEDWNANIHYYTMRMNTPSESDPNQYVVFVPKKRGGTFSTSTTYYRDDSDPEKRQQRLFYTDAGLSFEVNAQANFTTTSETAQPYKYYSICCWNGNSNSASSTLMSYPEYWARNSSVFNPQYETSYDVSFRNWYVISPASASELTGWARLLDDAPTSLFFIETTVDNVKYYGIALIRLSSDQADAYPTYISCKFFEDVYWGASVVPGGDVPEGQWGPSSDQSGGTGGSWDYSGESIPDTDASMLPAAFVSGSVIKCYAITDTDLNHLAERLYNTDSSLWTAWSNRMYSPASALIALHYLPTEFSGSYDSSNLSRVSMAGQSLDTTGTYQAVNGYAQTDQWRDSPTYTLSVPTIADSFVDMAPYTRMTLHVPFCGVVQIDPARCTGGSISVRFRCDAMTGNISARITLTDRFSVSTVMMALGNCAYQIPIMGKTGGAAGAALVGGVIGALGMTLTGNFIGAAAAAAGGVIADYSAQATQAQQIQRSGDTSPLLDLCLWLEISRAIPSTPADKQTLQGVPANVTRTLLQLEHTGFVRCSDAHLQIETATEGEIQEIYRLLRSGIILK